MTREEAKRLLPFVTALAEGRQFQILDVNNGDWTNIIDEITADFFLSHYFNIRIKPEPTYRPFKNADECWKEMQKHQPFGWVKSINNIDPEVFIYCEAITKIDGILTSMDEVPFSYDNMYRNYTFADGTPFGVKEE